MRALSQSGLWPSNCRLLDEAEGELTMAAPDGKALLVLGFESADHPVDPWLDRALELARDHGGEARESKAGAEGDSVGAWRNAFVQAPYLRDTFVAGGVISETFETAITWDRWEEFVQAVRERAEAAVADVCGEGRVTCRFTHVYPDGPAPYFTVLAPGEARRRDRAVGRNQGRGVGRDRRRAAARSPTTTPSGATTGRGTTVSGRTPFAEALAGAKGALDPGWNLNPGVLMDAVDRI